MSDSYQAIYDAVRSRISGGNVSDALDAALREAFGNVDHHVQCALQDFQIAASEMQRPSAIYRPTIGRDGNLWCALYGENLQEGVAGFGNSPAQAMHDFDRNWWMTVEQAVRDHEAKARGEA